MAQQLQSCVDRNGLSSWVERSAKEVMFSRVFVCLLVGLLKKTDQIFMKFYGKLDIIRGLNDQILSELDQRSRSVED